MMAGTDFDEKGAFVFPVPPDFDEKAFAADLAGWLKSDREMGARVIESEDILKVGIVPKSGAFKRLMERKFQSLDVLIRREGGDLKVLITAREEKRAEKKDGEGKSVFSRMAERVTDRAAGLAGAAVDSLAGVLAETGTADAIIGFVSDYVVARFRMSKETESAHEKLDPFKSRFVQQPGPIQKAWLAWFVREDECLLAWLETGSKLSSGARRIFVMTSERTVLAAFSDTRMVSQKPLPKQPLKISESMGTSTVLSGELSFKTQLFNEKLFRMIARLPALEPEERIFESARLNFSREKKDDSRREFVLNCLSLLCRISDDPLYPLTRLYVEAAGATISKDDPEEDILARLTRNDPWEKITKLLVTEHEPHEIARWADGWEMEAFEQIAFAENIRQSHPDVKQSLEFTCHLLGKLRDRLLKKSRDTADQIVMDLRYAESLLECGKNQKAVPVLEQCLEKLPDERVMELLPDSDSDPTKGEGGQVLRVRVLTLMSRALEDDPKRQVETLRMLAMLQPLVTKRFQELFDKAQEELKRRAGLCLSLLKPGGLRTGEAEAVGRYSGMVSQPSEEDIHKKIRHPAGRIEGVTDKILSLVASSNIPDYEFLKNFTLRVTADNHPDLHGAVSDAQKMLGVEEVEVFISHGEVNVGIRGYKGKPHFLVVGAGNIEQDGKWFMTPRELRHGVAAEIACIKFGLQRITSRDVWHGAFGKTMTVMEFIPLVGPLLGNVGRIGAMAATATNAAKKTNTVRQYIKHLQEPASYLRGLYQEKITGKPTDSKAKPDKQSVIGAYREMLLTSDRAGLVLCQDPRSAIRAMFLSDPKLNTFLAQAQEQGLSDFISGVLKNEDDPVFQDLAVRVSALLSFFISDDGLSVVLN